MLYRFLSSAVKNPIRKSLQQWLMKFSTKFPSAKFIHSFFA